MMDVLQVMIEEYKALRAETVQTMNNRNAILNFGIVALSGFFLAGINALSGKNTYPCFSFIILYFFVPIFSQTLLFHWLGEVKRMERVGEYVLERETKINKYLKQPETLYWEHWLNGKKLRYPYIMVIILLWVIATGSLFIAALVPKIEIIDFTWYNIWIKLDKLIFFIGETIVLGCSIIAFYKIMHFKKRKIENI